MLSNCRSVPDSQSHTTYEAQLQEISTNFPLYTTPKPPILPTFTNNPTSAKIPFPPRKNKPFVTPFKNSHITTQSVTKFSNPSSKNSPRKNEAKNPNPQKDSARNKSRNQRKPPNQSREKSSDKNTRVLTYQEKEQKTLDFGSSDSDRKFKRSCLDSSLSLSLYLSLSLTHTVLSN